MRWWVILLAVMVLSVRGEDDGDWVDPFLLPVGFAVRGFFAGYLNVSASKALYYVYTPSENNPSKDPLVVMVSPGPGCSSLHSWLYSKGEFTFTRNTTNFRHNPHNWNKQANVLYIEGPAGVGFSVGVETEVNDNVTQIEYFRALLRFYEKFPELKDQRMYLTGYGYAGIIAPKLALNIFEHNADPNTPAWLKMNISGLLLFNPCTLAE
jgi:carboxypeptidase C (cathepsin A)